MLLCNKTKKGFTLIELLLVIIILGVLAALISGNFINSLKKGRDAKRKADLGQVQKALEMYYEDKKTYPLTDQIEFGSAFTDSVSGKIYMQKLPDDPTTSCNYYYTSSDGTSYQLYSYLENNQDQGEGVNQNGYDGPLCGEKNCPCRFGVSSSNTTP